MNETYFENIFLLRVARCRRGNKGGCLQLNVNKHKPINLNENVVTLM